MRWQHSKRVHEKNVFHVCRCLHLCLVQWFQLSLVSSCPPVSCLVSVYLGSSFVSSLCLVMTCQREYPFCFSLFETKPFGQHKCLANPAFGSYPTTLCDRMKRPLKDPAESSPNPFIGTRLAFGEARTLQWKAHPKTWLLPRLQKTSTIVMQSLCEILFQCYNSASKQTPD